MREFKSYYNRANVTYGIFLGFAYVGIFFLFGLTSFWEMVILFVVVAVSTPAVIAKNDAIREEEEDNS